MSYLNLGKYLLSEEWRRSLRRELEADYFLSLGERLSLSTRRGAEIFPPADQVFNALNLTPLNKVKVVIVGQDPYHGEGQAMGMAFSVPYHVKIPPSLRNILREVQDDIGRTSIREGDLSAWADQGVLLLNSVLTVEANRAGSHVGWGWERFTDAILACINQQAENSVFLLWGAHAAKKASCLDDQRHSLQFAPHPSPLSAYRGFFGSKPFSSANLYLERHAKQPIEW